MASALYPSALKAFLDADVDLLAADVRAQLVDTADETYNPADVYLSDVTAAALVGAAVSLTGKTTTGGVFDAEDTTIPDVTGDPVEAVLLYAHTGTAATSRLIAWLDPVAFTPNTGACTLNWQPGGIFAI